MSSTRAADASAGVSTARSCRVFLYAGAFRAGAELGGAGNVIARFVYAGGTVPAYIRQGDGTGSRSEDRPGGGRRRTGDGRAGQRAAQEADKVELIPHGQGGTKTRGDGRRTDPLDL